MTFIDLADVAEVAASTFVDPEAHDGEAYTLTGPQPMTFEDVVHKLTRYLDREIRYDAASIVGYLWHLKRRWELPVAQAVVQTILHVGLRFSQAKEVDPTLARLLDRAPRTIEDYISDNVAIWSH